jgi:hypothetical protein
LNNARNAPDPVVAAAKANADYQYQIGEIKGALAIGSFVAKSVFGDSRAATIISGLGTAYVSISDTLNQFSALIPTAGPLQLASAIAGGISIISSLFDTGPAADQLILQGIQQLTDQIDQFWTDMQQRLDVLESQNMEVLNG